MSTALFIVLQREIEGLDPTDTNGQAISRHFDSLEDICEQIGVRPLSTLTSMNPDELADLLGGDPLEEDLTGLPEELQQAAGEAAQAINQAISDAKDEIATNGIPAEEWFAPAEGLIVVRGLQAHFTADRKSAPQSAEILGDLAELEQVLRIAQEHDVPFHFAWDF